MFSFFKRNKLVNILPQVRGKYLSNVPMSKHTWFAVGGNAEVMYIPEDDDDLSYFLKQRPRTLPICIVGGGSNILVRDGGIPGVVIKLDSPFFKKHEMGVNSITCFAGMNNIELKKVMLEHKIGGLEFLCSIPGRIGGSIRTNAGCFGVEVKDVIMSATIIDNMGTMRKVYPEDLKLSYRSSFFPDDWILISITFKTKQQKPEITSKILEEHKQYRMERQPYNQKTAGSTFKNPEGLKAWELIKNSGCCDLKVGGATVSDKHCNFLINTGNATASDIESLGNKIIEQVKEKTTTTLEWEIKKLGINK